ncbi:MAG: DUF11 domain-containing protein [Micrococcales bacterium]|nr:DUF11 domain-containing protein [Micrococcales bacterium]
MAHAIEKRRRCGSRLLAPAWLWLMAVLLSLGAPAQAAPAPGGAAIRNVATATYVPDGFKQSETVSSNPVQVAVLPVEALLLTQDQNANRPPNAQVTLSHLLSNTGNVASSYTLTWVNGGAGCAAGPLDLSALRVVRDVNNNGVVDADDPVLPLGSANALTLQPGEMAVLLVQGTLPTAASGAACLTLVATTALQGLTASNRDTVNVVDAAVISLVKSASYPGVIVPGTTRIDFTVTGTNIGARDAQPTGTAAPGMATITVNGAKTQLVLVRDLVPAGTQYLAGTLRTQAAGALRLFRLPGDAPFTYRTADDASAIEVAIGVPSALVRNGSLAMQFAVKVKADHSGEIRNDAQGYYDDGAAPAVAPSNPVVITTSPARIGVAKAAGHPRLNRDANGAPDGTMTVDFSVRVRNYGGTWLYGVQANDVLEGTGATQFGAYTPATLPGPGQYTIVPGSLGITLGEGVSGVAATFNPDFNGTASGRQLLAPGAVLPVGGEFTVRFSARINVQGRTGTLLNSVRAEGAPARDGAPPVFDDSVDGTDPDPDGDGDPTNNTSPTSVLTQAPMLTLEKTASPPRRVSTGVYELDYHLKVSNRGNGAAPNVRLIDNFNCAFDMDRADGAVASWQLAGPVRALSGQLVPAASFTGNATCNRELYGSADPFRLPTEIALSLVDGSRSLAPGESAEVMVTVLLTEKPGASDDQRVTLTNKAWAAAFERNTVADPRDTLVDAVSSTARAVLTDPQGVVYDAETRQPVAGATLTLTRPVCNSGAATPITLDELVDGNSGRYTATPDGGVSMTTGADGAYVFLLQDPPVTKLCTYHLAVKPPAGSSYVAPSEQIPAHDGSFAACGRVVPGATAPQGTDPTTYYFDVVQGFNADGSACDVAHNHIPLDPGASSGLVLRKDASRRQVEFGDFLDYALTVTNKTGQPVNGITFNDTLPPGLAYIAGSARLNGAAAGNPVGGAGPQLSWQFPSLSLAVNQAAMLRFRVRVGVGAPTGGSIVNRAIAASGTLQSNLATAIVTVTGGVFSDEAFVFGKVYMDCRRDRQQEGADEPGVPGVRLYLEDGTNVVTDAEGKWSLYGLKPITHVLRLDETTLPPGTWPVLLDNRNAGDAASRFVDLKKGELHKANFPLAGCDDPAAMDDVKARRKLAAERPDADGEAAVRSRLDPQGNIAAVGDQRTLPASGQVSASGASGTTTAPTQPLITLPSASAQAGGFVGGAGGGLTGTLGTAQSAGAFHNAQGVAGNAVPGLLPGGVGSGVGTLNASGPNPRGGAVKPLAQPLLAQGAPEVVELEKVMPGLDNQPGFIGLKDGDTVATQSINVRVKGPAGVTLALRVNGQAIDERRVGKKATLPSAALGAWEYIGVALQPGANTLRLETVDGFGVARGEPVQIAVVAPDKLGAIVLELPAHAVADQRTPVPVKVRLTDAAGVPVTARAQLTLEADRGRWIEEDLNPDEPGTQVFMDGGEAVFHLLPPGEPGELRVRVSTSSFVREARLPLLPDLRPMIGVGIVEGTLDFTRRGKLTLGQMPAGAAFETELRSLSGEGSNARAGGRAAFFFKGAVKGEYLLTAALDTDKSNRDRLFRDIRPDEFYPVYGDSSARGFDAQSSQRLYVRIDKNHSYLLYGDFITASSAEVRQLSQSNRALTGMKHVYETEQVRATSYASRTSQTQQVEEFAARGISGPYYLGGVGDLVENSERVEILVRDRNQPNLVLQVTPMTRFVDYTIEPLSRRILFTRPIGSVDANLNPQSIRVTYEIDAGGPSYTVAGTDVQVKVGDNLQLGVVASTDRDPQNRRELAAVTALARLGEHTSAAAELVRTDSDLNGVGAAGRVELRHQDDKLGVAAQLARTSQGFDNPGSTFASGRTEANARAEYALDPTLQLRGEAIYSKDNLTPGSTRGATASVQKKLGDHLTGEAGLRYGATSSASASLFDYNQVSSYNPALGAASTGSSVTMIGGAANAAGALNQNDLLTARGRLTAQVPNTPQAQVFVEAEQDLRDSRHHMAAVGGSYAVTDKTRLYGRYEFISTFGGLYDLDAGQGRNVAILGVESSYMEGGRIYNEYRLADAIDGATAQNAIGVRNTFKLNEHWRLTGGVERTQALGGGGAKAGIVGQGSSTAVTGGAEYTGERVRASGILEGRHGDDSNTVLSSVGAGYKLNADWSLLARGIYSDSKGNGASAGDRHTLSRYQLGLAYRPVDQDVWNVLARYERRSETVRGAGTVLGAISGNALGFDTALPGSQSADIVSLHFNANPQPGFYFAGRLAAKWSALDDGDLKSSYAAQLLQVRLTRDLGPDWDAGIQAGVLHGNGGAQQKTLGLEVGYRLHKNLWLSVGYNIVGLSDRDLLADEYTSKGGFIRLRFKFDETRFGFPSAESAGGAGRLSGND